MTKAKQKQEEHQAQPEAAQPEAAQAPESLTIQDLAVIAQLIDTAAKRGAFNNPAEYLQIGTIYNKLATFLTQQQRQLQEQTEQAPNTEKK